ncbi:MAG: hypothetical protein RTU30_11460 [Candidatus Thorarchaeota archaeon]
MKLVRLAGNAVRLLQERGDQGIRSDELAELLGSPKRRVYDIIAVLKALGHVGTTRRYDGTTVVWIDQLKDYIPKREHLEMKTTLAEASQSRKELQVEVVELREQLRIAKTKLRKDVRAVETIGKAEFNTCQIKIRPLSINSTMRVMDSGMEVVIETSEPGMIVDPTEDARDENEKLLKSIQRV